MAFFVKFIFESGVVAMKKGCLAVNQLVMEIKSGRLGVVRQVRGENCIVEWCVSGSPALSLESRSFDELRQVIDPLTPLVSRFPGVSFILLNQLMPRWRAGPLRIQIQYRGVFVDGYTWRLRYGEPGRVEWVLALKWNDQYEYFREEQADALLVQLGYWSELGSVEIRVFNM